ncbi:MAG: hypothetical protein LBD29_09285 [Treponema sp.]|jgi:hypothetical protein|nr:hypothetical protein [Treponema sp.]
MKKMKKWVFVSILLVLGVSVYSQNRSFDRLFPQLDPSQREQVFSSQGLGIYGEITVPQLLPPTESGVDIAGFVLSRNPSHLAESLLVIQTKRPIGFIQVYNALGNIRGLKGRLYNSFTRKQAVPLFEDATRIVSDKKTSPLPDPEPAKVLPSAETAYIRLKDVNFGNTYYQADFINNGRYVSFRLSNFRNITYLVVPVIKEQKFTAELYFEILAEGLLVYSIAGAEVSNFVASKIDIPSAIQKRLEVFTQWVVEGILSQDQY